MARDNAGESGPAQVQQAPEAAGRARESAREDRVASASAPVHPPAERAEDADKMRQAIARLERENRRLRKRCEDAELEINHLEKSLSNVENTLSFRLGYALIHSTKSLDALRSLPSALLELSRDSRRRKGQSRARVLLATLRVARGGLSRRKDEPPPAHDTESLRRGRR